MTRHAVIAVSAALAACTSSFESDVRTSDYDVEVVANDVPFADGLAFHPSGSLLVSEEYRGGGVLRVDPSSGSARHIVRDLADPDNLLVLGEDVYVTEEDALGRILKIDGLERVTVFASGLDNPEGLDLGPDGAIYVVEHAPDGHVYRFTLAGERETLASATNGEGLRVLDDGSVVVAETSAGRVARFLPGGSKASLAEGLQEPDGVAYDRARERLLVTEDAAPGRLLAIEIATTTLSVVAEGLNKPQTMLIEDDGSILVTEQGENRILRLRPREPAP